MGGPPPTWLPFGDCTQVVDAEADAPILGPPDVKSQLNGKDPDSGKD